MMGEEFGTCIDTSDVGTTPDIETPDVSNDIPDDVPNDIPADIPENELEDLVNETPDDIPEDIPEDIQEDEPKDTVADIPDDIPEDISEDESQESGDNVVENTSDDEPGNLVDDAVESSNVEHESPDIYDKYSGKFFNEQKLDRNYDTQSAQDAMDITHDEDISIKRYSGDGYRAINESLYDPEYVPSSEFKRQQIESDVRNITECLERKEIPYDSRIYRGVNDMKSIFGDDFKNMSIDELNQKYSGTYFENKGFTSASTSEKVAERFANSWNGGLLSIEVPKGAKGMCIGDVSLYKKGEKEVLLQRGTMYRINSVGMRNRQIHVDTTAIGC